MWCHSHENHEVTYVHIGEVLWWLLHCYWLYKPWVSNVMLRKTIVIAADKSVIMDIRLYQNLVFFLFNANDEHCQLFESCMAPPGLLRLLQRCHVVVCHFPYSIYIVFNFTFFTFSHFWQANLVRYVYLLDGPCIYCLGLPWRPLPPREAGPTGRIASVYITSFSINA